MAADSVVIRTGEGIEFTLPLAGPFSRMLAFLIDFCVIAASGTVLNYAVSILRLISADLAQAAAIVLYFVVSLLYGILTEWLWRGQTVGKRLLRLRVMDANGLRLQPSQVIVRNLLRAVDLLPGLYLVGGVTCLLSSRRQRLGDLAGGTIVIRADEAIPPDVSQIVGRKYNSLAEHRHLAGRLRSKVPLPVAQTSLAAVMRRDELQPAARLSLFKEFVAYFSSLVEFPPEVTEQLSDEQYVRNVVGILFRPSSTKHSTDPRVGH